MTRTYLALPFALLALAAGACADLDLDSTTQDLGVWSGGGSGEECPKAGCSSNSPFLGPSEFHELDETGASYNAEGFKIASFTKTVNGTTWSYRLDVTGTTLTGKIYFAGSWITALSGQSLVGSKIEIVGTGGRHFEIVVTKVSSQAFWQPPAGTVETYELKARDLVHASHYVPVCTNPPDRLDGEGKLWSAGPDSYEAILFTGNRYDLATKTVTQASVRGAGPWFNIGCFGNVLAKIAINHYAVATSTSANPVTVAQQQTMMKMYTSDLCGTGQAFTVQGTPIRWFAANGWSSPATASVNPEAYWNENGALCLDTHRLNGTANDMTSQYVPACNLAHPEYVNFPEGLPPCASLPGYPDMTAMGANMRTTVAAIPD